MKQKSKAILEHLIECYPLLEGCKEDIVNAFYILKQAYEAGRKVLICGKEEVLPIQSILLAS